MVCVTLQARHAAHEIGRQQNAACACRHHRLLPAPSTRRHAHAALPAQPTSRSMSACLCRISGIVCSKMDHLRLDRPNLVKVFEAQLLTEICLSPGSGRLCGALRQRRQASRQQQRRRRAAAHTAARTGSRRARTAARTPAAAAPPRQAHSPPVPAEFMSPDFQGNASLTVNTFRMAQVSLAA